MGFRLDAKRRAVRAPELHYLKSATNWFLVTCLNDSAPQKGSFILRSTSGRAEGPYENIAGNAGGPIFKDIDGSLFEDDDGTVWFVGHNHYYARMKADLSGFDGGVKRFSETEIFTGALPGRRVCFQKRRPIHLLQAAWSYKLPDGTFTCDETAAGRGAVRWSYDCIAADADRLPGPYGPRYTVGAGIGHYNFSGQNGQLVGDDVRQSPGSGEFKQPSLCRPMIVPLQFVNGRFGIRH